MTHSRPAIREFLDGHGLSPRRDLGQNFVADPNTVRRIADLARVGPGDHVVEVGAGLGSLTLALAETGATVTAVEVDRGVVPVLESVVADADASNVTVVEADAMHTDWNELVDPTVAGGWTLVANLPYNVGTPLVCDILDFVPHVTRLLVMVQREVAERFAAAPGDGQYGAISVKASYWGAARVVGHVPAAVFFPKPNVESALVEITRRDPPDADAAALFALVKQAFGQRRKMLRKSLSGSVTAEQFVAAHVAETARPEELGVDEWVRLANIVGEASKADSVT
ncbi:MAG: 16S rRNA (adenine(1518)-N(6)/adenine(1519)-N(6))-dimethyltransferase RsmA [Ilumatobacter sp.]